MSKHTPGPWELIETPHEKIISNWHIKVGEHEIHVHPYKRIWSEDRTQSGFVTDDQHMADARLIAAAPDLLEALQSICNEYDENQGYASIKAYDKASAAIAKATGGGSMSTKDGGPAFPVMEVHGVNHGLPGMTLRDYFAAKALPAAWEIENKHPTYGSLGEPTYRGAAERAYQLADAAIAAKEQG